MARSTVAILKTSPATVPADYHASMTLAVFLAVLAQDRETVPATAPERDSSHPRRFPSRPFEWCFTTVLAPYVLVASVLSQSSYRFSRRVRCLMAQVPDFRRTGLMDAPEFASRRWHPLPPPA
jgi:hypothetical protein